VRALVKLVQDGSVVKKSRGRSKKAEARPLVRPIICICNDAKSPKMKPLESTCAQLKFTR